MAAISTMFETYANDIMNLRYSHIIQGRKETWSEIAHRNVRNVISDLKVIPRDAADAIFTIIRDRKFIPGGRILSQAGRAYHQTDNCFMLRPENTREGWADHLHKVTMMFMSGGGVGADYSDLSCYGTPLKRSGGIASGPIPLLEATDAVAKAARQGGERRGANYGSLVWDHADIKEFIHLKNGNDRLQHTNISVRFNQDWQHYASEQYNDIEETFLTTLQHACQWGDPGFQFDNDNQILRNACTEVISADDCDSCCLGSINLAKISTLAELADVAHLGVLFLLCNTMYTDTPHKRVQKVKEKNRRLGLGLMGIAEWFIQRSLPYGHESIATWLRQYKEASDISAHKWADYLNIARPIATRAIAPTGTISIAGGHTTPGIEPVFCQAYIRTYNTNKTKEHSAGYKREIVIDPVIEKLLTEGYNVDEIDTAYHMSLSTKDIERRIAFQALCQRYVDNAISSTVNLPTYTYGIEEKIAPILLKYLPDLRGITFYPNGRHEHQPVTPVDLQWALQQQGKLDLAETCKGGVCGI